jgi:tetratricopeptide (TPR) repeat protein
MTPLRAITRRRQPMLRIAAFAFALVSFALVSFASAAPQQERLQIQEPAPQQTQPSDAELAQGQKLLDAQDWKAATSYWRTLHERFPRHGRTLLLYAVSHHGAGDYAKSLDLHRRVSLLEDPRLVMLGQYNSACAYARLKQPEPALYTLYRAVKSGFSDVGQLKSDPDLASLRGDIRFQKLVFAMEDGEPVPVAQFKPTVRDAQLLVRAKRYPEALAALEIILERQPGLPFAVFYKGYCLHQLDRHQDALPLYVQSSAFRGPIGYVSSYNLACIHARLGARHEGKKREEQFAKAFEWLGRSFDKGYRDLDMLQKDADLESLRKDTRWPPLVQRLESILRNENKKQDGNKG